VLDAAAVKNDENGMLITAVNRHPDAPVRCSISIEGTAAVRGTAEVLTGESLHSFNSYDRPDDLAPREGSPVSGGGAFDYVFAPGR